MTLRDRFSKIPYNLDAVNIGSGPSFYDFDWEAVPKIAGCNMAVAPEDFRYDERIIRNYGMHLKPGAVVVVVVCPLSFGENEYLYQDAFSEKYASILPFEDVDLPFWKYFICRNFPWALWGRDFPRKGWNFIKRQLEKKPMEKASQGTYDLQDALIRSWLSQNKYLHNLKEAGQAAYYQDVFQKKVADLEAVIETCLNQGLFPVLLIPPLSAELRANISQEFIQKFVYDNMSNVMARGVPLLDYIDNIKFFDGNLYTNGLFLKPENRGKFTRLVWKDIQAIKK